MGSVPEVLQGRGDEGVGGGLSPFLGPLAVKGLGIDPGGAAVVFLCHSQEPFVYQGGLAHSAKGHQFEDMAVRVIPGSVQLLQDLIPTKEEGAGGGQPGNIESGGWG